MHASTNNAQNKIKIKVIKLSVFNQRFFTSPQKEFDTENVVETRETCKHLKWQRCSKPLK